MSKYTLIFTGFLLFIGVSAYAGPTQLYNDPPPQCPYASVDMCMWWTGDGTGTSPQADTCTASGGARCAICATDATTGAPRCGNITMDASCKCDSNGCVETGKCTYYR